MPEVRDRDDQGIEEEFSKQEDTIMPRGDGTGPMGMGARTGRSVGYCAGSEMPGYANPAPGRGFGMGFGRGSGAGGRGSGGGGRGWRKVFFGTAPPGGMWLGD